MWEAEAGGEFKASLGFRKALRASLGNFVRLCTLTKNKTKQNKKTARALT